MNILSAIISKSPLQPSVVRKVTTRLGQFSDWRWRRFYLQRRFLSRSIRELIANWLAARRQSSTPKQMSSGYNKVSAIAEELRSKGIVPLGQLLDKSRCNELYDHFQRQKVRDVYRTDVPPFEPLGEGRTPDCHIAHHEAEDVIRAPYILALANRPELLEVAETFLGCKPTISYIAVWWSYPTETGPQQAENYHRDVDDWRFLKLFVYLTDVDENNGPHFYVIESAGSKKMRTLGRFKDDAVKQAFGGQSIRCITGEAGTAFLENTFGIHKGCPVESGHRLVCQVVYSMFPLPYGPREPVLKAHELEGADCELDPFINRVYLKQ